jgi:dihydroorotase
MPPGTILIDNARVINPASGLDGVCDILISEGRVAAVEPGICLMAPDVLRIQADGLIAAPGLVDAHVHFREPGFESKETIETGARAAAAGGFTAVICEPNLAPPPDTVARAREMAARAEGAAVRIFQKACITVGRAGEEPVDVAALNREPNIRGFSDDGDPLVDRAVMAAALACAAAAGAVLSPHEEDSPAGIERRRARPGRLGFRPRRDYENEPEYVGRDIALAKPVAARLHVSHASLAETMDLVRMAKRSGLPVSCEVAPHHFCLDTDFCGREELTVKVNPPIRSPRDRTALLDAIADGTVDLIASDHAPHTAVDKEGGAHGVIGLETTLGLVATHLVAEQIIDWPRAVELLSVAPARVFGLETRGLAPSAPADVTLIDPTLAWTVDPEEFRSHARNCPFAGWSLHGRAVATIVGGAVRHLHPAIRRRIDTDARLEDLIE